MINKNRINAMDAAGEPLEQCIASGQVSATQIEAHRLAGKLGGYQELPDGAWPVAQMWVVYTPRHGYEDSEQEQVHLICSDQGTANACKDAINSYASTLKDRIVNKHTKTVTQYRANRVGILAEAAWPYGINRQYLLDEPVNIKPLPFVGDA